MCLLYFSNYLRLESDSTLKHCSELLKNTAIPYFASAWETATATATVMPTIGLLPAPRKPIIST